MNKNKEPAKYKNTYRIESARLKGWDYRCKSAYFITICTHEKHHYFGDILNGNMKLSPLGVLADVFLYEIKNHADNIELGNYIVMPNHIHLILIINQSSNETSAEKPSINQKMASISPKAGSVSTIIRSYKAAVSRHANRLAILRTDYAATAP